MVPPIVGKYNQYNSYTLPIGRPALESLPLRLCSQVILSPVKLTIKSNYRYINTFALVMGLYHSNSNSNLDNI